MSVIPRVLRCVVLGAPGAGKGTLCRQLASIFDMVHVSMGDIIWSNVKQKTKLGILSEPYVRRGELVPDGIMSNLLLKVFKKFEHNDVSWILDGYPRTERQASFLWSKSLVDMAIHLNLPLREAFKRHENKLVHIASGRSYNEGFNDPQLSGKDDITGEPLEYRDDNHKDIVMKRYEEYEKHKRDILMFYDKMGVLYSYKEGFNEEAFENVKEVMGQLRLDEKFLIL